MNVRIDLTNVIPTRPYPTRPYPVPDPNLIDPNLIDPNLIDPNLSDQMIKKLAKEIFRGRNPEVKKNLIEGKRGEDRDPIQLIPLMATM